MASAASLIDGSPSPALKARLDQQEIEAINDFKVAWIIPTYEKATDPTYYGGKLPYLAMSRFEPSDVGKDHVDYVNQFMQTNPNRNPARITVETA